MNNLHRELAPISSAAWEDLGEEVARTFRGRVAARRTVDVPEARGTEFSALTTGHLTEKPCDVDGVRARMREVLPVLELRAPFTLQRSEVDSVARGATDADWGPAQDAAAAIARAEDRAAFLGDKESGIQGMLPASTNDPIAMPDDLRDLPAAVAAGVTALRLAEVQGPFDLLLSADLFTKVSETTDHGSPIYDHIKRELKDGSIIWAPALDGALLLSVRGGDFELQLGPDLSIGYLSHDAETIDLYLQETFTFRVSTPEASIAIG